MEKKIVDARGVLCPKPLIMTKKALEEIKEDGQLLILLDNETAKQNVERYLKDNKIKFETDFKNDVYSIIIRNQNAPNSLPNVQDYCVPLNIKTSENVIVFKNDKMGFGNDDLGSLLIKGFINAIKEVSPLPKALIYNNGALLAAQDNLLSEPINILEKLGVKIMVCGACVDFFGIKDKIKPSHITNMFSILETLNTARNIIYP